MNDLLQRFSGIIPLLGDPERYEVAPAAVNPPVHVVRRTGEWFGIDPAVYPNTARELAKAGNYQEVIDILFNNSSLGFELLVPIGDLDYRLKIRNLFDPEIRNSKFFYEFRDNAYSKYGIEVLDLEQYYDSSGVYPGGRGVTRSELGMFTPAQLEAGRTRAEEQRYQAEMQVDPVPQCGEATPDDVLLNVNADQILEYIFYPDQAAITDETDHAKVAVDCSGMQMVPKSEVVSGINLRAILNSMNQYPSAVRMKPTINIFKKLRHRSEQCTNSTMRRFYDHVTYDDYERSSIEARNLILDIIANDYAEYKRANTANRKRKKEVEKVELRALRSEARKRREDEALEWKKPPDEKYEPEECSRSPSYAPLSPSYQPNLADE